jgi:hypothetical protein
LYKVTLTRRGTRTKVVPLATATSQGTEIVPSSNSDNHRSELEIVSDPSASETLAPVSALVVNALAKIPPRTTENSKKTDITEYPSAEGIDSSLRYTPKTSVPDKSESNSEEESESQSENLSTQRSESTLIRFNSGASTPRASIQPIDSLGNKTSPEVITTEDQSDQETEKEDNNMSGNGKGLPLSGTSEAPATLTKDQTIYGVAEFWDKCQEIFRVRDKDIFGKTQDLKNALLAYMDPWARRLYVNDYDWTKAENKEEIEAAFFKPWPGAKDVSSGSVRVLESLMRRYSGLNLNTADAALQYCRDFKAEAMVLRHKPNCKLTGYQLVNMFEKCLDRISREAIRFRLTLNKAFREAQLKGREDTPTPPPPATANDGTGGTPATTTTTTSKVERGTINWTEFEDWEWYLDEAMIYFSQDLMDVAMHIHTAPRGQDNTPKVILTRSREVKIEDSEMDDIRQSINHLKDVNETNKKFFSQQNDTISKIWSHIQSQPKGNQGWTPATMDNRQYGSGNTPAHNHDHQSKVQGGPTCFFCGGDHMVGSCEHVQNYIDQGKLMKDPKDGRFKLPDGRGIPGTRDTLWKKRLDDYWKDRLPSTPSSSLLFYGEEDVLAEQYKTEVQQLQSLKQELIQMKQGQSFNHVNSTPGSQLAFQAQDGDIDYQRLAMQLLQQNLTRSSTSGSEGF